MLAFPRYSIAITAAAIIFLSTARHADAGVSTCTGDCNGSYDITVNELVAMVNIALGQALLDLCKAGDRDDDGNIQVAEIVRAVNNALHGCEDEEPPPFKHRIDHPSDPYFAFSAVDGGPSWVKFTIRVDDPTVVYFQNSADIPFHQDFVSASLEPYIGWTPAQIDAVSLRAEGQELVFGAVLYSPNQPSEIGIQLVRQDAYSVDEVIAYFSAVRASINAVQGVPFLYFPTFEQQDSAEEHSAELADAGIPLGSTARWLRGDVCYAAGWAHGRVVFVAGEDIEDAYADGTLKPTDILLTDGVPAQIPFVAGVMSLAASTPNSHVAILAGDWQIPFVFLSQAESVEAAQALVGGEAILRATTLTPRIFTGVDVDFTSCQIRLVDVTGALDEEVVDHLQDLKRAPDLDLRPVVLSGTYSADVATATPDDTARIGGKAANYGFLLRAIPQNARIATAFTFDLWNDYLDQPMEGGVTLRAQISELLAPFPTYPPSDFAELFDALDDVRDLIDDEADFTPAQRTSIIAALEPFDQNLPIRFRSSTNVEDSDVFTGAGLYESESGCLADELDGDSDGPSLCDASRDEERGVFRALRKVFQSFYNDNAFLERLRHRIDETTVGMAVLVNHTFTDDTELANGVATLGRSDGGSASLTIVSQPGAFSVTTPEDGGLPEVVEVFTFGDSRFVSLRQGTTRLPLGATVLQMPNEYIALTDLLLEVGDAFGAFHGESAYNIEFEFKKIVGEGLDIKQVRRIPRLSPDVDTPPVLIHSPVTLCTFQGERGDVFGNYRLKSRWQPLFASGPLADDGVGMYESANHRYVLAGDVLELTGAPSTWPNAAHGTFDPQSEGVIGLTDSWTVGNGASARTMTLRTMVPTNIGPNLIPIVFPEDLGFILAAEHETPVPHLDFDGTVATRTEEETVLYPCTDGQPLTPRHLLQEREVAHGAVAIDTAYYWPPFPTGAVAGYTAPVERFVATTIAGVTTQPIELVGYFSQTYRPEHHNFSENFLFAPHLEEGIPPAVLGELETKGIRALVLPASFDTQRLMVVTTEGALIDYADLPQ